LQLRKDSANQFFPSQLFANQSDGARHSDYLVFNSYENDVESPLKAAQFKDGA
jgi:hypothetical protein